METIWHSARPRMGLRNVCYLLLLFVSLTYLNTEISAAQFDENNTNHPLNEATSPDNPFKKLNTFTVFATSFPNQSEIIITELAKLGHIKQFSLTNYKELDFSGCTGAMLSLVTAPLHVMEDKVTNVVKVSLSLRTTIEVLKTKNDLMTEIWSKEIFCSEENISQAIREIIQEFAVVYRAANPNEKVTFNIYL